MRNQLALILAVLGMAGIWPLAAGAEQSKTFGDYVVHYNALTTDNLQPNMARRYGITRSPNRVLLNVSVLKKVMGTTGKPVEARVRAYATNLNNQLQSIYMREVHDRGAIYYLGNLGVNNGETLNFQLEIMPEGRPGPLERPFAVSFKQQFFTR